MSNCAFCESTLDEVMDFGSVALAGGFLKPEQFADEKKYPLRLCFCPNCSAVQLADRVEPDVMFKDYFYFSSATETVRKHFREYAAEVVDRFKPRTALEIGCNDGVLLNPLSDAGVDVMGIDPSNTVPKAAHIINDYFTTERAAKIGQADMVIANNVFAHVADIRDLTEAVVMCLAPDGVFVMEAHYLGAMLDGLQYDWIYHEHLYYYSLMALEKHFAAHGLEVFDVKRVALHGGSMRYYVRRPQGGVGTQAVVELREFEKWRGLDKMSTYLGFKADVEKHRRKLRGLMECHSGRIAGYGASGRANAILQYTGIDVDYLVDDAPAKHGFHTPGSHIPIYSAARLAEKPPASVLVFAWNYLNEIRPKCGEARLIVPLPDVRVVADERLAA